MKNIIIDIREEHELKDKRIEENKDYLIYHIPQRFIVFNKDIINILSENNKIYIMCRSGKRAENIKNKYFSNNTNIEVLEGGIENINNKFNNIKIKENKSLFNFGPQQYMQLMFVFILFIILFLIIFKVKFIYIYVLILLFIFMILYQVFTKSCYLTKFIPFYSEK